MKITQTRDLNNPKVWDKFTEQVNAALPAEGEYLHDTERLGRLIQNGSITKAMDVLRLREAGLKPPPLPEASEFVVASEWWHTLSYGLMTRSNTLLVGPTQCGKTEVVRLWGKKAERPVFHFNVGGWFNPSSQLIGNTHFTPETGTVFRESDFVKAVKTPNAVILVDEFTRAEYHVQNALMNCLDGIRELRLDGHPDCPVIKFAEGVSFAAAANVGSAYKGTQALDAAVLERFPVVLQMEYLSEQDELKLLLSRKYSNGKPTLDQLEKLVAFAQAVRKARADNELKMNLSTARCIELAEYMSITTSDFRETYENMVCPLARMQNCEDKLGSLLATAGGL